MCVCVSEWGMSDRVVYGSVDNANGYLCLCLGAYVRENDIIDKWVSDCPWFYVKNDRMVEWPKDLVGKDDKFDRRANKNKKEHYLNRSRSNVKQKDEKTIERHWREWLMTK